MTLPPRAWRTLYNVADALRLQDGSVPDLEARLPERLPDPGAIRALRWTLALLEIEARLRMSPGRGFSWLARPERSALLARWERSPFACRREALARLRRAVGAPSPDGSHSRPGA